MRTPRILFPASLLLAALLSGCGIYFGDDDDDCLYGAGADIAVPAQGYRNPQSGQCEYLGPTSPPNPCGDVPAGRADEAPGAYYDPAALDWAMCFGLCAGLDEATCRATDACRAIYVDPCPTCGSPRPVVFSACWGT